MLELVDSLRNRIIFSLKKMSILLVNQLPLKRTKVLSRICKDGGEFSMKDNDLTFNSNQGSSCLSTHNTSLHLTNLIRISTTTSTISPMSLLTINPSSNNRCLIFCIVQICNKGDQTMQALTNLFKIVESTSSLLTISISLNNLIK